MPRLVVFDLDGTLVRSDDTVSGYTHDVLARVKAAGDRVGEPAWPMPLPDDVRKGMESDVADLSQVNAGMDRAGHMLQGGIFLSEFVPAGLPFAGTLPSHFTAEVSLARVPAAAALV